MTADTTWVELPHSRYPILFETGSLSEGGEKDPNLLKAFVGESVLIVSNQTIADQYAAPLMDRLTGLKVDLHLIPEGEAYKTLGELERIIETLLRAGHTRETSLIALGGGVVGDMTGFAAAIYQRGVPSFNSNNAARTSRLFGRRKNGSQSFAWQKHDRRFPSTRSGADDVECALAPAKEFAAGMAEVVKHALLPMQTT